MKRKCVALVLVVSLMTIMALPTVGLAADPVDSPDEASPTEMPVVISAPAVTEKVTLADLVTVAKYVSGSGTLTEEQMERFDLEGDGQVTMADLQLLAKEYIAEINDEPSLPEPNPETATVTVVGTITTSDEEASTWYVRDDDESAVDETGIIVSDDTIIVDCVSGDLQNTSALVPGTRVAAYISVIEMPSLPPRAACFAVITNVPDTGNGNASYVYASQVKPGENGSVVVLNQNSDLYVTVPDDIPIGILGQPDAAAAPDDIREGTRFIAWFDIVGLSYPGQTTALRVMIASGETTDVPQPSPEYSTRSVDGTVASVDSKDNTVYLNDNGSEVGAVVTDDTVVVDCATAQAAEWADIPEGAQVRAYLSTETLPDSPSKSYCRALLLNPENDNGDNTAYVYVTGEEEPSDAAGTKVVINQNEDFRFIISDAAQLSVLGEPETNVSVSDISSGTRLIVWYEGESSPAVAKRVLLVPDAYSPVLPGNPDVRPTENILGSVESVNESSHTVYIMPGGADTEDAVAAVWSDDSIFIDCASGALVDITALKAGDRVSAYIEPMVTPSLPPTSGLIALITNLPDDGTGFASYVCASEVNDGANGNVIVLNQNADLFVTLPADMEIGVIGETGTAVSPSEVKAGSRLIVWFDIVATSYPAQTTALRAMIMPEQA